MAMRDATMTLVFFISVVLITTNTAEGNLNIHHTISKLHARDVLPSQDPMKTGEFESLIQCASVCQKNEECKSFAYNQPYCHLLEDVYDVSGSDHKDAPGFKYYYVERNLKNVPADLRVTTVPPTSTAVSSTTKMTSPTITVSPPTQIQVQLQVEVFKLTNGEISWDDAEKACKNQGRQLVSILSKDVQNLVKQGMESQNIEEGAWIGLKSIDDNFNFQWLEGTKLENAKAGKKSDNPFQTWHEANPDNHVTGSPVRILGSRYGDQAYTWTDEDKDYKQSAYICN